MNPSPHQLAQALIPFSSLLSLPTLLCSNTLEFGVGAYGHHLEGNDAIQWSAKVVPPSQSPVNGSPLLAEYSVVLPIGTTLPNESLTVFAPSMSRPSH